MSSRKKTQKPAAELNEETQVKLLEAYLKLAYKEGVRDITIQKIANEAGVTFGTVRYHYHQEDRKIDFEAIKYVIKKAYGFLEEAMFIERTKPSFNPLHAYVKCMLDWVEKHPEHASFVIYYYYICTTQGETPLPNSVFLQRAYLRIESLLNESIGAGLYSPVQNKVNLVRQIHTLVLGASVTIVTARNPEEHPRQLDLCLQHVDILMKFSGLTSNAS